MTDATYWFVTILLAAIPGFAVLSGKAAGMWRWVNQEDEPIAFWVVVGIQITIFVVFLFTGRSWHLRQ
jgi:uncharacterized membrane protein YtjA (UPF0391 family)